MNRPSHAMIHCAPQHEATNQVGISRLVRAALCGATVAIAMLTGAPPVEAQQFRFRVLAGNPVAFPIPTEANFDAGFVLATDAIDFDVDARTGASILRSSSVSIRATSGVMGGSKPIGDLQWRRADLGGAWTSMTTTNAVVQSMNIRRNALNDPWSNSIEIRVLLDWTTTPPATYTPGLVLTLTIAPP